MAPPAAPGRWARSCCGEGSEPPLPWLQVEQGPAELTWGWDSGDSLPLGTGRGQGKEEWEIRGEQSPEREMKDN